MEVPETTRVKLYSPCQIALAAFIGSPLAACWFWSRNYLRLGQASASTQCLIWGVVGTVALFTVTLFLPRVPGGIPAGYTVGFWYAAKGAHGAIINQHRAAGGRLGSWWAVVGISVLWLLGFVVFAVAIVSALVYFGYISEESLG